MTGLILQGRGDCTLSHAIRDWCYRNRIPVIWQEVADLVAPQAFLDDGTVMTPPSLPELAAHVGFQTRPSQTYYDVAIVGAGPAGLSAAIYAGSEGLRTCLIEKYAVGGQAGSTSFIENLMGYPRGVTGCDFAADALEHALRFGLVDLVAPTEVEQIVPGWPGEYHKLILTDASIEAKAIIVATGASYRQLNATGIEALMGRGIYYGASLSEAPRYAGRTVFVIGGGNSAGQAVLHFSKYAKQVYLVLRHEYPAGNMSHYLVQQVNALPNVTILTDSQVSEVTGTDHLETVVIKDYRARNKKRYEAAGLFVFIGAIPHTGRVESVLELDEHGYILTGPAVTDLSHYASGHAPDALETSVPGIFAAGDVRRGSIKRVAAGAGEGAVAVTEIHNYLAGWHELAA